jgi:hypothetical protein
MKPRADWLLEFPGLATNACALVHDAESTVTVNDCAGGTDVAGEEDVDEHAAIPAGSAMSKIPACTKALEFVRRMCSPRLPSISM